MSEDPTAYGITKVNCRQKEELISAAFRDIIQIADRTTSGNVAHNARQIKAIAIQCLGLSICPNAEDPHSA